LQLLQKVWSRESKVKTKSELKEWVVDLTKELSTVKYLRLDDAGENFALEKLCKQ